MKVVPATTKACPLGLARNSLAVRMRRQAAASSVPAAVIAQRPAVPHRLVLTSTGTAFAVRRRERRRTARRAQCSKTYLRSPLVPESLPGRYETNGLAQRDTDYPRRNRNIICRRQVAEVWSA